MLQRLTALCLCLSLLLVGCSNPPAADAQPTPSAAPSVSAQSRAFTLPYYPDASLHPILGDNRTNQTLTALVYQGLFQLDNSFRPQNLLCRSYEVSEDGLSWTFFLNPAVFSDGTSLTADDAAFSLRLAASSALYAARLSDVRTIAAQKDPAAVVITLTRPNAALPALLDIPILRESDDGALPIGTGPYFFAEDSGPLRLVRSSSQSASAPEEIALLPVRDADELIYAFDSGEISLLTSDLTGANTLGYSAGYESFDYPTTTMLYVGFQTAKGPCRDRLVRQAISDAFDRTTVTDVLLAGHAEPCCLPLSPRSPLYPQSAADREYSPDFAAQALLEAGYSAGADHLLYRGRTPLTLVFAVNTDNTFKITVAEYLTRQLEELGVTVELRKLSWEDYSAALESGDFDLYLAETALTADFDPAPLLSSDGALNYGGWSAEETQVLLSALRFASADDQRSAADALYKHLLSEMPLAPLCFKSHSVLTQWNAVSGLTPTRQNPFYSLQTLRFS